MSLQLFIANKLLIINEIDGIKSGNKSIEKSEKLLKTKKSSKSEKLRSKKTFKS